MIGLQIIHSIIAGRRWKQSTKLAMFVAVFLANLRYNANNFMKNRPETLYDAFNVTRHATFEDFQEAKNHYIQLLDIEEDNFNQTKSDLIAKLNATITEHVTKKLEADENYDNSTD